MIWFFFGKFVKSCEYKHFSDIIYSRHKFFSSLYDSSTLLDLNSTWVERFSINSSKSLLELFLYYHFLVLCRYRVCTCGFLLDDDPGNICLPMKYSYLLHFEKLSKIFTRRERFSNKKGFLNLSSEKKRIRKEQKEKGEKGGNEIHKNELFYKWNVMFKYALRSFRDVFLCKNLFFICITLKVWRKKSDGNCRWKKVSEICMLAVARKLFDNFESSRRFSLNHFSSTKLSQFSSICECI